MLSLNEKRITSRELKLNRALVILATEEDKPPLKQQREQSSINC